MLLPINPRGRTAFIITLLGLALGLWPWCGESSHALPIASARAATAGAAADSPTQADPGSNSSDPETEAQGEERAATAEADLVIVLERTLERDEPILQSLRDQYDAPDSEFIRAEAALKAVDSELAQLQAQADQLNRSSKPLPDDLTSALESASKKQELAQKRFEIAFEERKAIRDKITALEQTVRQAIASLTKLTGAKSAADSAIGAASDTPTATPTAPPSTPALGTPQNDPDSSTDTTTTWSVPLPGPARAAASLAQSAASTNQAIQAASDGSTVESRALREARQQVYQKEIEAEKAEEEVAVFQDRYLMRKRELDAVQRLLDSATKKADVAAQQRTALQTELAQKQASGASETELSTLQQQIDETRTRLQEASAQMNEQRLRAQELETTLAELEQFEDAARQAADAKRQEVEKALRHEKFLESPLHPQNLLRWVEKHAPTVIGIVVLMIIANLLIRLLSKRIVGIVARTSAHGTPEERENRAHTLVGVFRSSASLAVIASGFVMILDECGVPVGPLLGGAAIVGLAVAFGAQRLISDFFHGFVILLENQYKVNDVIRVAGIAGLVERISLRITVLRDLEGCLHFVPNGEIKSVTNMTHGWSRALFEIGVAYKEDADHVMEVLMELAHELRKDAKFGPLILEDPQMLGVDAMADSAIIIKFFIKTRPLQQWAVKREMLRRIKRRFDELGIEIPFPHRTIYLRHEADTSPAHGEPATEQGRPSATAPAQPPAP